jgi:hypothetical protein
MGRAMVPLKVQETRVRLSSKLLSMLPYIYLEVCSRRKGKENFPALLANSGALCQAFETSAFKFLKNESVREKV